MDKHYSNALRAEVLTQALPYIQQYNGKIVVVKYGGNAMINEQLKEQVMEDLVLLNLIGVKVVLVHGGGPEISDMMQRLGKKPEFVNGLRVTDKETIDIVQMVLAGKVNKSLVNLLEMKGGTAMGLSGMDAHLIRARVKDEKLGFVGAITDVNVDPVMDLLEKGYIPVISTTGQSIRRNDGQLQSGIRHLHTQAGFLLTKSIPSLRPFPVFFRLHSVPRSEGLDHSNHDPRCGRDNVLRHAIPPLPSVFELVFLPFDSLAG